jgi:hypothetical protein
MGARAVEIISGRDHHDRNASSETLECDWKFSVANHARAHAVNVCEPEHLAKKLLDKIHGRGRRRRLGYRQFSEHGLADTKVSRNLVAQRQSLGNIVVGILLCVRLMLGDASQHCRRNQCPFYRYGIESEPGPAAAAGARHRYYPAGTST